MARRSGAAVAALAALLALGFGDAMLWTSAAATAVIAAMPGALGALAMWLVAYRAE